MDPDEVEVIAKETPFDGYFRIDRYRLRHRLHDGGWSGEVVREVFERGHAVCVLPYDPRRDEVVLVEQFRMGPFCTGEPPWLLESVAGIIEDGETVEGVARRETREETGLEAEALAPIAEFFVSPGGATQFNRLFCARVDASRADGIHGLDHEGEDILVHRVSLADVPGLIAAGRVRDATTLIALQWLLMNRAELSRSWAAQP